MFDTAAMERVGAAVAELVDQPVALATGAEQLDLLRQVTAAKRALDAVAAVALEEVERSRAFADEGASSLTTWAARELRMSPREARSTARAAATLRALPRAREALVAGRIGLDHVRELTLARRVLQPGYAETSEEHLVLTALEEDPAGLRRAVQELKDLTHPEWLDEAWARGEDHHYLAVARSGEGYVVEGYVDILTGARLKSVLDGFGRPVDAEDADTRTRSQRRIDGLNHLLTVCTHAGEDGVPPEAPAVRADLHVIVDHATLTAAMASADGTAVERRRAMRGLAPAVLTGHGRIGADLLEYLGCGADRTGVLTTPAAPGSGGGRAAATPGGRMTALPGANTRILNVGRTHRLATPRQRTAVAVRQGGTCAAPSCRHPIAEVHHTTYWSEGGTTDLDHLIGLCARCHVLVHQHRLVVTAADGVNPLAQAPPRGALEGTG